MDSPVRKRARVDDADSNSSRPQASEPKQDEELWHADGNIILVAQNVSFRVYRGILAEHSPVFADMFTLPQSPNALDDGCPIVHLDDSPQDLRYALCALFPRKTTMLLPGNPDSKSAWNLPSVDQLSAYARLGHKYQLDSLVNQTVQYLKNHFTSNLNDWCAMGHYVPLPFKAVHAIGVVNIARFLGCDILLPVALSVCATLDPEEILKGYERGDGTWEKLCQEDVLLCLRGKAKLSHECVQLAHHTFIPDYHSTNSFPCIPSHGCERNTLMALRFCRRDNPFLTWDAYKTPYVSRCLDRLCKQCRDNMCSRFNTAQKILWSMLPDIFGLTLARWPGPE